MTPIHPVRRAAALQRYSTVFLLSGSLLGCGGGGGGDNTSQTVPSPPVESTPVAPSPTVPIDHPQGQYWSWTTERTLFISPDGWPYYVSLSKYVFPKFFDNGLVYVGPPVTRLADLQCYAPSRDADGNDLCVRYTVENGKIKIGDADAQPIGAMAEGWSIGDKNYLSLAPQQEVRLDGLYISRSCYLATCSQAEFVFKPDGTFTASSHNIYANTIANVFMGVAGGADSHGTYRIKDYSITIMVDGAPEGQMFFFREGDSLQIAEDRYVKQ
ncbi:MAG: hypothetical protein JF606_09980 [Burkholderiales bacterium]|nr:hypothetical protein [Burkholderiales bacterium]